VSLSAILEEILEVYGRSFERSRISVEKRFLVDGRVLGFPVEIRQVFLNLIGNAIQAMSEGGRLRVQICSSSSWTKDGLRSGVRVNVLDTGHGIPREYRDRLFEPFFTTKSEKGTGLGLWVSRGIVEKLEGTIRVRSCIKKGTAVTCFSVFLPADLSEEPQKVA
jgi:signal transduction histidine kinase